MWGSYRRGDVLIAFFILVVFGLLVGGGVTWMQEVEHRKMVLQERVIPKDTVMVEAMTQSKTTGEVIRFHIVVRAEDALKLEDEFLLFVRVKEGDYVAK